MNVERGAWRAWSVVRGAWCVVMMLPLLAFGQAAMVYSNPSVTNRLVICRPLQLTFQAGVSPSYDTRSGVTDANGNLTLTNVTGGLWSVNVQGPPSLTSFCALVPTNNWSYNWQGCEVAFPQMVKRPQDYSYSAEASDQRYIQIGGLGGAMTNHFGAPAYFDGGTLAISSRPGCGRAALTLNNFDLNGNFVEGANIQYIGGGFRFRNGIGVLYADGSQLANLNGANIAPNTIPIRNLPQLYSGTPGTLTINPIGNDWYLYSTGGGSNSGGNLSALQAGSNVTVRAVGTNWVVDGQTDTNMVTNVVGSSAAVRGLMTNIANGAAGSAAGQIQAATQALASVTQPSNQNLTAWSAIAPSAKQNTLGFQPATNGGPVAWSQMPSVPLTDNDTRIQALPGTSVGGSSASLSNSAGTITGNTNYVPAVSNFVFGGVLITNLYVTPVGWTNMGGDYFYSGGSNPKLYTNANGQFGIASWIALQSGTGRAVITNLAGQWVAWSTNNIGGNYLAAYWPWNALNVLNTNFSSPAPCEASLGAKTNVNDVWNDVAGSMRSQGADLAQTNREVHCYSDGSFVWGGRRYQTGANSTSCGIMEAMRMLLQNTVSQNGGAANSGGNWPGNVYGNSWGGKVLLESGQFNTSQPITIPAGIPGAPSNARMILTIEGAGRYGSTVCNTNSPQDKTFNLSMSPADCLAMRHMTVCSSNFMGTIVNIDGAGSVTVEDCCIAMSTNGFYQGSVPTNDVIGLNINIGNCIATIRDNDFIYTRVVCTADHCTIMGNMWQFTAKLTYNGGFYREWPSSSPFYCQASVYLLDPPSGPIGGGGQTFDFLGNNRFIGSQAHYFFGNSNKRTHYVFSDYDEGGMGTGSLGSPFGGYCYTTGSKVVFINAVTVGTPDPLHNGAYGPMTCWYNPIISQTDIPGSSTNDFSANWVPAPHGMVVFTDVGGVDSQRYNYAANADSTNAIGPGATFTPIGPLVETNMPAPTPSYPGEFFWWNSNGGSLFLLRASPTSWTWTRTNVVVP